ncbi:MAG TPA: hypothetical protein VHC22_32480 [Pirellulales bacterium]|nr:hypothetical protein [Pirellulales bacterium]
MPLGNFAVGEYKMTYGGQPVGLITSGGEHLRLRPKKSKINDTASYGDTLIDGVYRGMDCSLMVTFKEWNVAVQQAIWPYGGLAGMDGSLGIIARLDSNLAKPIVLTAVAGTPASLFGPVTFSAELAILSDANDVDVLFGPDQRDIPVIFDLLLYDNSGIKQLFTIT